jgi:CheY-like chemotaxis protein
MEATMDRKESLAGQLPAPTAEKPLLGMTMLVVEDSRFACEAVRLLCLRSGARIRRADCLGSARRHLRVYRPSILLVDLGLPDGNGTELIAELSQATPRIAAILGMSGDPQGEAAALAAGADGFMAKPFTSVGAFQNTVLSLLPSDRQPKGPRQIDNASVAPDRIAYHDDIAQIAEVLEVPESDGAIDYAAQFLAGVAHSAEDWTLEKAARRLARKRARGEAVGSDRATLTGMIQDRLSQKLAI